MNYAQEADERLFFSLIRLQHFLGLFLQDLSENAPIVLN